MTLLIQTTTIRYMPKAKRPKPPHGIALEVRRAQVQKSLDDIVTESEGRLYKQLLYRLENGKKDPDSLTYEQTLELSRALEWSVRELNDVLGVDTAREDDALRDLSIPVAQVELPVVNAGAGLPQWNDEAEMVTIVVPETMGKDRGNLFCVRVTGDSMTGYASNGDLVVFEKTSVAELGQVVAVHIPDDGLIVKRYYGGDNGLLVLGNENRSIEPRTFPAPEGSAIYGVSIGRWQPD